MSSESELIDIARMARCEEEISEECQPCDGEVREEHQQWDCQTWWTYVDVLRGHLEEAQRQAEVTAKTESDKNVKVTKLTEGNIEVYHIILEQKVGIGIECWIYTLITKLTGKVQQAYAGVANIESVDYKKVEATFWDVMT